MAISSLMQHITGVLAHTPAAMKEVTLTVLRSDLEELVMTSSIRGIIVRALAESDPAADFRVEMTRSQFASIADALDAARPSALYRPKLFPDGNQWCALYGDDLQSGCAGFGDTPEQAMAAFDKAWREQKPPGRGSKTDEIAAREAAFIDRLRNCGVNIP